MNDNFGRGQDGLNLQDFIAQPGGRYRPSPPKGTCWRRRQIDPEGRLCLTRAFLEEATLSLRLRAFIWVTNF